MKVLLYTSGCPQCRNLEKKLKEKNIEIIEHNIVDSEDDLNYIMNMYVCYLNKIVIKIYYLTTFKLKICLKFQTHKIIEEFIHDEES